MKNSQMLLGVLLSAVLVSGCSAKSLKEPENLAYSSETKNLTWDAVANATSYELIIHKGEEIIQTENLTTTVFSVKHLFTNGYTAFLTAKADGYKDSPKVFLNFIHSKAVADTPVLPAITGLAYNDGVISWDALPEALYGYVAVLEENYSTLFNGRVLETNSYTLEFPQPAHYVFKVAALGKSEVALTGPFSVLNFTYAVKIEAPVISYSSYQVNWAVVSNAQSYQVVVTKDSVVIVNENVNHFWFSYSPSEAGTYFIKVKSLPYSFETYYLESDFSNEISLVVE